MIIETIRLDKWLWIARFAKTRSKATELCNRVKVNRIPGKPSKDVRAGDTLTITIDGEYRTFEILGIAPRPIPPREARELYRETTPPKLPKEADELMKIARQMERQLPKPKGRPTKERQKRYGKSERDGEIIVFNYWMIPAA